MSSTSPRFTVRRSSFSVSLFPRRSSAARRPFSYSNRFLKIEKIIPCFQNFLKFYEFNLLSRIRVVLTLEEGGGCLHRYENLSAADTLKYQLLLRAFASFSPKTSNSSSHISEDSLITETARRGSEFFKFLLSRCCCARAKGVAAGLQWFPRSYGFAVTAVTNRDRDRGGTVHHTGRLSSPAT
jgi:hypothetical protein